MKKDNYKMKFANFIITRIIIPMFLVIDIIFCIIQLQESSKQRLIEDFETKKVNLINLKFLSKKLIDKCIIKWYVCKKMEILILYVI